MNKVMTANGITGARAETSWVMSGTGFSGFAQASLRHLLKRATEGFLPTARLFAHLCGAEGRFRANYGIAPNNGAISRVRVQPL
jgi:hypothetical protein